MKTTLLVSLLAALTISACTDTTAPGDGSVIMPLKVGNHWIYSHGGTFDTLEITGTRSIGGETWYVANTGDMFINKSDGLHSIEASSDCHYLRAKYPAQRGDHFDSISAKVLLPTSPDVVDQVVAREVVSIDTVVTAYRKSYKTYHYTPRVLQPANAKLVITTHEHYVVDLGMVVRTRDNERWELVEARL